MQLIGKIKNFIETRSRLDLFLLKSGGMVLIYYIIRITIKFTPFLRPIFVFSRDIFIRLLVKGTYIMLHIFGYDAHIQNSNIVYIAGSQGVLVINACIGWAIMALYIGFILIYPGKKKAKYWFIPLGLVIITIVNVFRITGMAMISYHNYESLAFYHRYIFNFALYLAVFIIWFVWVSRYGIRNEAQK